MTVKTI